MTAHLGESCYTFHPQNINKGCCTYHRHVWMFILLAKSLGNADSLSQRMAHLCATGVYWHRHQHTHTHIHSRTGNKQHIYTHAGERWKDTFAVNLNTTASRSALCVYCRSVMRTTKGLVITPWKNMEGAAAGYERTQPQMSGKTIEIIKSVEASSVGIYGKW